MKWEEPASRGRRSFLGGMLLWHQISQNIDLKLDGATWGLIYLGRGGSSHNHIMGIYLLLSDSTEPIQGEGLAAQLIWINVLWSTEQPVLTFFLFFFLIVFLQNLPGVSPSGKPLDSFHHRIKSQLSATHLAFFTSMSDFLNSSLRSWFTTLV